MSAPASSPAFPATAPNTVRSGLTPRRSRRPRRVVETDDFSRFVSRIIRAFSRRVAAGDIACLSLLTSLRVEIDEGMSNAVAGLRAEGYSWSEIGTAVGITKQSAYERWNGSTTSDSISSKRGA